MWKDAYEAACEPGGTRVIMAHRISADDRQFIRDLETGRLTPAQFDHRAHVRAAYVYLAAADADGATDRMRLTLLSFLERHGVPASKYHATMTRAWILAVRHFMERTPSCGSAHELIEANPQLLDSRIMLTHYSAELLFSPEARSGFMEPDRSPIPRHE
jgi:hypothetical protein